MLHDVKRVQLKRRLDCLRSDGDELLFNSRHQGLLAVSVYVF